MKKISEFRVGDAFHSTCSISDKELEEYLNFSRVRNAFLEDNKKENNKLFQEEQFCLEWKGNLQD